MITFNGGVHVVQPLTTSSPAIRVSLSRTPTLSYGTHIYDALARSADILAAAQGRPGGAVQHDRLEQRNHRD